MDSPQVTRRSFATQLAALLPLSLLGRLRAVSARVQNPGISRTAEAIHQEVTFKSPPSRLYEALLDEKQFAQVTGGQATTIDRNAGGALSLFGARIKGRNIELVSNERIVQAWRSEGWDHGVYSIVRFELKAEGTGTRLVFDHAGFPTGQADHLASGWKSNYWDPLTRFLGGA
ncbi:MAG TPA: SRPBCC domain-containing protein [Gemmatimonadales bacterium]|nr:SRPBCC domain-containing protein [Gemmatimonadales bacterium]